MTTPNKSSKLIGVVGVCASGKSTLIQGLEARGYRVRHIAQEHSYVKDMWKRITHPDLLIFLDAAYTTTLQRRKQNWTVADWTEQQHRLRHARTYANFYLNTDALDSDQVLQRVVDFLMENRI